MIQLRLGKWSISRDDRRDRLATKAEAIRVLRANGLVVDCIFDVGVREDTPDLRLGFPDLKHYLFEPVHEFHAEIAANYRDVPHELLGLAASDRTGPAELATRSFDSSAAITHSGLVDGRPPAGSQLRPIEGMRLDDFIAQRAISGPILLKIDVDGAELKVMEGARGALAQIPCVIMEASRAYFYDRLRFMYECGYALFDIIALCYYHEMFHQADLVFLQKGMLKDKRFDGWQRGPFDSAHWQGS